MGTRLFSSAVCHQKITYFDVFFREVPDGGGFAIAAGLEQVIEYIQNLRFDKKDLDYLRN
jgi:nicotinate phosphoribosyltransferase